MATSTDTTKDLPSCEAVLRTKPHANGRKMVYECPCGQATNPDHCPRTLAIEAERNRRANAYPKLIEFARMVTMDKHQIGAAADALLSELGEAKP